MDTQNNFLFIFYFCLLLITTLTLSKKVNEDEKYTDWMGRHRWFPISAIFTVDNPIQCLDKCFDAYEFLRVIIVPCDIWLPYHNQTHKDNATCTATAFAAHDDEAIYLVFRGTTSGDQKDEETAAYYAPVAFPGGGKVNRYFLYGFKQLWKNGLRNDFLYLREQYPKYKIRVTGSSLGGALSALASAYLSVNKYAHPNELKLVTFGEPRVGDKKWAINFSKWVPWSYRITHRFDHVPHWPFNLDGYVHHHNEIWYNNSMEDSVVGHRFKECKGLESSNCINTVPASVYNDTKWFGEHGNYFNNRHRRTELCRKNLYKSLDILRSNAILKK